MVVFESLTDVRAATDVLARTLAEFTTHGPGDLCLEAASPDAADLLAIRPFLRADARACAEGRLRRPSCGPAWELLERHGLGLHDAWAFSEHGISWHASRVTESSVYPRLSPVAPHAAASAQPAHRRDRSALAGHHRVRVTGPKGADWEATRRHVEQAFAAGRIVEGPTLRDGSRAGEFEGIAVLDAGEDVRRFDEGAAAWAHPDWIRFTWSLETGQATDDLDAALRDIVIGEEAPADERLRYAVGDVDAHRATPNLLPEAGVIEPLLETMLARGMRGALALRPMTWRCPSRPEPYTHWESRLELRILARGLKLLVEFHVNWAAEKPLVNLVRREYRQAMPVARRAR